MAELTKAVVDLRARVSQHQAAKLSDAWETAPDGRQLIEGPFGEMAFSYQRYDLQTSDQDWLTSLYATTAGGFGHGLLFSSGMGVIAAVAAVLSRRSLSGVAITPFAYFETHLLLQRFFPSLEVFDIESSDRTADVIWVDTSSTKWRQTIVETARAPKVLVVDTTCFDACEAELRPWLTLGEQWRCPVILVRSHLKLDTFGLELGRLGSAVVVDSSSEGIGEAWALELKQARSGFGTNFFPTMLYPWLGQSDFVDLAIARGAGIRLSTDQIEANIDPKNNPKVETLSTEHKLFFLVRTGLGLESDSPTVRDGVISHSLADACAREGLPVFAASSFGLDRVTITDFVNMHDDEHYIRISGADLPPGLSEQVGATIASSLKGLVANVEG